MVPRDRGAQAASGGLRRGHSTQRGLRAGHTRTGGTPHRLHAGTRLGAGPRGLRRVLTTARCVRARFPDPVTHQGRAGTPGPVSPLHRRVPAAPGPRDRDARLAPARPSRTSVVGRRGRSARGRARRHVPGGLRGCRVPGSGSRGDPGFRRRGGERHRNLRGSGCRRLRGRRGRLVRGCSRRAVHGDCCVRIVRYGPGDRRGRRPGCGRRGRGDRGRVQLAGRSLGRCARRRRPPGCELFRRRRRCVRRPRFFRDTRSRSRRRCGRQ